MGINLLRRFNLFAPSTPYSSARSNIDHFLYLEKTNYKTFLNPKFHFTAKSWTNESVYLSHPISLDLFKQGPRRCFEFSHHNPANPIHNEDLSRRVSRFMQYRNSSEIKEYDRRMWTIHLKCSLRFIRD